MTKWKEIQRHKVPVCKDILFSDGIDVFCGWLETHEELEDPVFYDAINKEWPECITHWMPLPKPPEEEREKKYL